MNDPIEVLWRAARCLMAPLPPEHLEHTMRSFTVRLVEPDLNDPQPPQATPPDELIVNCGCGKTFIIRGINAVITLEGPVTSPDPDDLPEFEVDFGEDDDSAV